MTWLEWYRLAWQAAPVLIVLWAFQLCKARLARQVDLTERLADRVMELERRALGDEVVAAPSVRPDPETLVEPKAPLPVARARWR